MVERDFARRGSGPWPACLWLQSFSAASACNVITSNGWAERNAHAHTPKQEREAVAGQFARGRLRCVVATVAFGMGVDAQGVRAVVHMSLPQSLEEYVQQARALIAFHNSCSLHDEDLHRSA